MKYKYVIVAVVLFIIAVIALPSVFSAVSESYTKEEESYFSKSSYFLKGQVYKYEYLGGINSLLYIQFDSISINKRPQNSDTFTGLYDKKKNIAVIVAVFDHPDIRERKINTADLPYVTIDSEERKITYSSPNLTLEDMLRPAGVYEDRLTAIENKEGGTRF